MKFIRCLFLGYKKTSAEKVLKLTVFRAEYGKGVPQFPEEVHEREPHHAGKKELLPLH